MPIALPFKIRNLSKPEFDERDQIVMRCAYASQNSLGQLCDESVYENDLALRLKAEGFPCVYVQIPVIVSHEDFQKHYRLDLVADHALYELKTVIALISEHRAQALHYAMLADISHSKLLNFRGQRVQGKLHYTPLSTAGRQQIQTDESSWRELSPQCLILKRRTLELLREWGSHLEVNLYEEALIHFCGGLEQCVTRTPISRGAVVLGTQSVNQYSKGMFFIVTAFNSGILDHKSNIQRLLVSTKLRGVQWINLNHGTVQFVTFDRESTEFGNRM